MSRILDAVFIAAVIAAVILGALVLYNNVTDPAVCWTSCP